MDLGTAHGLSTLMVRTTVSNSGLTSAPWSKLEGLLFLRVAWEPEREIPQFPIVVNQDACAETYIPLPETQTHE